MTCWFTHTQGSAHLLLHSDLLERLLSLAESPSVQLQVAKMVLLLMAQERNRPRLISLGIRDFLMELKRNCSQHTCADVHLVAESCLRLLKH